MGNVKECFRDCYYMVGGKCKLWDWDPSEEPMECLEEGNDNGTDK